MSNLKHHLDDKLAWKWIDVIEKDGSNFIDDTAVTLLDILKQEQIPNSLEAANRHEFQVSWNGNGLEPETYPEHSQYLDEFVAKFTDDMKRLITDAASDNKAELRATGCHQYPTLTSEIHHHCSICREFCTTFIGQKGILQEIEKNMTAMTQREKKMPLLLNGDSGSGISSTMAKTAQLLPQWTQASDYVCITRFIGTSPASMYVETTVKMICQQLCLCYGEPYPKEEEMISFHQITRYFRSLLQTLSNRGKLKDKPLFLVIDSLDRFGGYHSSLTALQWLPMELFANMYMIVSCDEDHPYAKKLRELSTLDNMCEFKTVHCGGLQGESNEVLLKFLGQRGRVASGEQLKLLSDIFNQNSSALLTKLLVDEATLWKSYTECSHIKLGRTIEEAIAYLFSRIEVGYGRTLVSYSLTYITVARDGLSEVELEDVLSCNDAVMDEVYQYHNPPVSGVVRIPSLLWSRIRNVLGNYLLEVIVHNRTVLFWYHKQFNTAATKRYIQCHGEKAKQFHQQIHADFAELYGAEESIKRTITLHNRKLTVENADRQSRPQPLIVQNKRKFMMLPHHLVSSNPGVDVLKEKVFCNLKWLQTKLEALGYKSVMADFKLCEDPDEEISLIQDMFMTTSRALSQVRNNYYQPY